MSRKQDIDALYSILAELRGHLGGYRRLADCRARTGWPAQGVYFFFEDTEQRANDSELRVVRVGTHAVSNGSRTSLWNRLAQHRGVEGGPFAGGGNHRGSVFRRHVGTAVLARSSSLRALGKRWAQGASAPTAVRKNEHLLERRVSRLICRMPFLWVEVPGVAGPTSNRKVIERNAIALLSNRGRAPIDPPSPSWLGLRAARVEIRESGLWNVDHVDDQYDRDFLGTLAKYVAKMA